MLGRNLKIFFFSKCSSYYSNINVQNYDSFWSYDKKYSPINNTNNFRPDFWGKKSINGAFAAKSHAYVCLPQSIWCLMMSRMHWNWMTLNESNSRCPDCPNIFLYIVNQKPYDMESDLLWIIDVTRDQKCPPPPNLCFSWGQDLNINMDMKYKDHYSLIGHLFLSNGWLPCRTTTEPGNIWWRWMEKTEEKAINPKGTTKRAPGVNVDFERQKIKTLHQARCRGKARIAKPWV